jgi:hypothetical protein
MGANVIEFGALFYAGPSLITGDPIVGIVTGLTDGSKNPKTGPIAQTWILRADKRPMEAVRDGSDDAICGDCKLRGEGGHGRKCYVTTHMAPYNVWKRRATYPAVSWPELQAVIEGRMVRLGAYGDPAAIPFEVWRALLTTVSSHIAYTHSWKICDPRLHTICMASVDSPEEAYEAWRAGWRTFRIRRAGDPLLVPDIEAGRKPPFVNGDDAVAEFMCPASDEANHKSTCERCRLCRGTSSPARSVAIQIHGKPSSLKAFGIPATFFQRKAGGSGLEARA